MPWTCAKAGSPLGRRKSRDRNPAGFIGRLWRSRLGRPCVGFKMTRGQNQAAFHEVLRDREVKKIILRRHNRVKTYVSWLIAQRTGRWEAYHAADIADSCPMVPQVEEAALRDHNALDDQYYEAIERELRQMGQHGRCMWPMRISSARQSGPEFRGFLGQGLKSTAWPIPGASSRTPVTFGNWSATSRNWLLRGLARPSESSCSRATFNVPKRKRAAHRLRHHANPDPVLRGG